MKKDISLHIRVSEDELKKLKRAADKATKLEKAIVSASELIRRYIQGLK